MNSKKRKTGMSVVKTLIVSLSLASVLGFWGLFSQQDFPETSADTSSAVSNTLPFQPAFRAYGIDLPPMPTLIPQSDSTTVVQPATSPTTQFQAQTGTTIYLGGAKPSSGRPAAVTVTQSSR